MGNGLIALEMPDPELRSQPCFPLATPATTPFHPGENPVDLTCLTAEDNDQGR